MAAAPIVIRLPGLTGLTMTASLYAFGGAQNAAAVASGLTLTADTQVADKYWTTTIAGLSGLYEGVVLEGATIRGRFYVIMSDTTNLHHAVGDPFTQTIQDLFEADRYVDTSTTPWRLVLIKQGSGTLSTGKRLLEQNLKTESGANVTSIATFVGQVVDVP